MSIFDQFAKHFEWTNENDSRFICRTPDWSVAMVPRLIGRATSNDIKETNAVYEAVY